MTIELGDYVALSKAWGSGEYRTRTPPNLQFHRSGNSRLRRLLPPGELSRVGVKSM